MIPCAFCDADPVRSQDRNLRWTIACGRPCADHKPRSSLRLASAVIQWDSDQRQILCADLVNEREKTARDARTTVPLK